MNAFFKRWWVAFAVAAQLALLVFMVCNYYGIVNRGVKIRLSVNPVDPLDLFCGRYVALRPEGLSVGWQGNASVRVPNPAISFKKNDTAYLYFETPEGEPYAKVTGIGSENRPGAMKIRIRSFSENEETVYVSFKTNLTRFYLDERYAPEVEHMVRRAGNTNQPPASIEVALKGGQSVITQLYIGDLTAEEACRQAWENTR